MGQPTPGMLRAPCDQTQRLEGIILTWGAAATAAAKRKRSPPLPFAFLLCAGLPGSVLVPLQLERAGEEATLLDYAMRTSRGAVYLQCSGALHARLLALTHPISGQRLCLEAPPGPAWPQPNLTA